MLDYEFTERAIRDINSTRDWYDQRQADLGEKFFDDVLMTIRFAREYPRACPEAFPGIRAMLCRRFSYQVYFEIQQDRILILAVYHTSRNPALWNDPNRP
jgi:toxin ParE1/3/4